MVRKAATVPLDHLPAGQRVDARRDQDVVEDRDQDRHRELRVEAEGDVGADHQQREDERVDRAVARPARRRSARRWCCRSRPGWIPNSVVERPVDARRRRPAAARWVWIWKTLSPNSRVARSPGSPRRSIPALASSASRTPSSSVGSTRRDVEPRARLEVDAEVELLGGEGEGADDEDHARDREEPAAGADEVEVPARPAALAGAEHARRAEQAGAAEDAEQRLGEDDRGQQRDDRADAEREGEALDPRRRQHEEDERGQQGDDVGVDDRRDPFAVAGRDRAEQRCARPAPPPLFARR